MKSLLKTSYMKGLQLTGAVIFLLYAMPIKSIANKSDSIPVKFAVQAARYCQAGDFERALNAIDKALQSEIEKDFLYTWYVKGFIHKEIYKHNESTDINSINRELAVEAFLKSKQIAGEQADVYNNNAALKHLANTYYNDALTVAISFDLNNETMSDDLLMKHEKIRSLIDAPIIADKGSFYKLKGLRYFELWQKDLCSLMLYEKSIANFELSIGSNPVDCESYYNEGIVKYTLATKLNDSKINTCYTGLDFMIALENALQSFLIGEKKCPQNKNLQQALFNTYSAMGNNEMASQYATSLKP